MNITARSVDTNTVIRVKYDDNIGQARRESKDVL